MSSTSVVPVLLSVLLGLLFGLLAWGLLHMRQRRGRDVVVDSRDDVLLGLLVLGAFSLGAFLAFILLTSSTL